DAIGGNRRWKGIELRLHDMPRNGQDRGDTLGILRADTGHDDRVPDSILRGDARIESETCDIPRMSRADRCDDGHAAFHALTSDSAAARGSAAVANAEIIAAIATPASRTARMFSPEIPP